jgi:hypothetical protein
MAKQRKDANGSTGTRVTISSKLETSGFAQTNLAISPLDMLGNVLGRGSDI